MDDPNKKIFWYPSPMFLAQSAHVGWGWALTLTCLYLNWLWVLAVIIAGDFIKEAYFDCWWEGEPFFWLGALDLGVFLAGGGIGWLTWSLK